MTLKPDQSFSDSTDKMPSVHAAMPTATVAIQRLKPFSTAHATAGSSSEIAELQAANTTSTKNSVPNNTPAGMPPKAIGSVWNLNPGPAASSSPLANTTGKIARPAANATNVSRKPITRDRKSVV